MKKEEFYDFEEFKNKNKDRIEKFCPPYREIEVSTLLWYFYIMKTDVNDKELKSILAFVYEHIDNSHELYDLAEMIKHFKETQ